MSDLDKLAEMVERSRRGKARKRFIADQCVNGRGEVWDSMGRRAEYPMIEDAKTDAALLNLAPAFIAVARATRAALSATVEYGSTSMQAGEAARELLYCSDDLDAALAEVPNG